MRQENLFKTEELLDRFVIDPRRSEPAVWIERLVILTDLSTDSIIREIPFHRGLNIIRTKRRGQGESRSAAHDVGKTLLMRLLRFTLGDDWYASKDAARRIQRKLPNGVVIATWHVAEAPWTVVRRLSDRDGTRSFVVPTANWHAAIADSVDRKPLASFLQRLFDVIANGLPRLELGDGASPCWKDALAWIARDSECGFRKPHTWRDREVNPRGLRDTRHNRLIMQWLMGLLSDGEADARNAIKLENQQVQELEKESDRKQVRLQILFDMLRESTHFEPPQFDVSFIPPTLADLTDLLHSHIGERLEQIQHELNVFSQKSKAEQGRLATRVAHLEEQKSAATRETSRAKTYHSLLKRKLEDEQKTESGPKDCPAGAGCYWLKDIEENNRLGMLVSHGKHLDRIRDELSDAEVRHTLEAKREGELSAELKQLQGEANRRAKDTAARISQLRTELGHWLALADQSKLLRQALDDCDKATVALQSAQRRVEQHKNDIANEKNGDKRRNGLRILNNCYSHVLLRVFDDSSEGQVKITNGLKPDATMNLISHGTALSAMTHVISFELACVLAGMCGLGNHPRLLMHDGPRDGEMESELFRMMLKTVQWLEWLSPASDASFQYIVTTADCPDEFDETHRCVVATLDGRTDGGLLLGLEF